MKFYVISRRDPLPKHAKRPFATLTKDNWNDFGYRTLFELRYHAPGTETLEVGGVKIGSIDDKKTTELESAFPTLADGYFSLGQSMSYYETIRRLPKQQQHELLTGLRDVVYMPNVDTEASKCDVFGTSFLRFSEAVKAYREAGYLFSGVSPTDRTNCSFRFTVKMKEATTPHVLTVVLGDNPELPDRIMALIGKNGTGKTWLLGRLAAALSGEERGVGKFEPERPAFNRVIAVSYSAFDKFNKPLDRSFSYVFCGIYDEEGRFNSRRKLFGKIREAAKRLVAQKRKTLWEEMLKSVLDSAIVSAAADFLFPEDKDSVPSKPPSLSSGQLVLISTITELLAAMDKQSIVLFDEPELHQHPNAVAGLLLSLSNLLDRFDSFAIIATHSPLVIQQIPSAYVRMFFRVGNTTVVREPMSECFGENLTTITQEVFQTGSSPSLYQEWFKLALGGHSDDDEIVALFPRGLSFNALSVLESFKQ